MNDVLFYVIGAILGAVGVFLMIKGEGIYKDFRKTMLSKGVSLTTIQFLEEQALEVIKEIEEGFAEKYEDDPDGSVRHSVAKEWLSTVVEKGKLGDKITSENLDTLISGTVKGAKLAKGINPHKK